mmetsp:Transcript_32658/g.49216  ORF Transcript_32658/g.49216 Transcript_32658/m.49216 type:complete len:393 (+) Transcript_32658:177-1355(+)|eukprot:CAMPEP_0178916272 /NCGR_PEP_ID=MMETSP0786-20121207/12528_1 /TAXON_ID=186022 /ORGANISM="Thalassionema frauenfeldii, Strain CCMP 1798" /LENGTH=392 /DNA_ID=CAMNT_0020589551 /DNA_START=59 /DNA_END=1237 /DNA_ORIENTATION=+
MSNSTTSKLERVIGGFVSLLSSALTLEGDNGMEPLKHSAGVLPRFVSAHLSSDDIAMVMPMLMIRQGKFSLSNGNSPKEKAALNLARPYDLTRKELEAVPMVLLANICESFTTLIDSRLRSSIQAILRQSRSQEQPSLNRVLAGLLAYSDRPISPCTVVTSFRVLAASEISPKGEVIMPLVMEAVVDLKIFDTLVTTTVVAPGTIKVIMADDFRIGKAEIVLDTVLFLQSLMKQARFAVRKAIALASKVAAQVLGLDIPGKIMPKMVLSSHDFSLNLGNDSLSSQKDCSLMPKPPRRPSKRSFADMTTSSSSLLSSCSGILDEKSKNATWNVQQYADSTQGTLAGGLSLLTAAAGMNPKHENDRKNKSQKTDNPLEPEPLQNLRKANSCPRL